MQLRELAVGAVKVEARMGSVSPNFQHSSSSWWQQRIGQSLPEHLGEKKVDIVLFRNGTKVPRAFLEIKRAYARRKKIIEDAERCRFLMSLYESNCHGDMVAYCAFPIVAKGTSASGLAKARATIERKAIWAQACAVRASADPKIDVICELGWDYPIRLDPISKDPEGSIEDQYDPDGFHAVPCLAALAWKPQLVAGWKGRATR